MEEEDGEDEEEEEDEDEQQLLGEFEKELEGMLLPSDRERLRSEVKAGMERELENIIQETEKELDPEGLRKESEREQAILALTSTLDKLIKRLQESQSPELVQKYKKRRVVPQKPPPSPHPTGESLCFLSLPREHCAVSAPPHTVLPAETPHSQPSGRAGLVSGLLHAHCLVLCLAYRQGLNELSLDAEKLIRKEELYAGLAMGGDCRRGDRQFVGFHSGHGGRWTNRQVWGKGALCSRKVPGCQCE